MKGPTTRQNKPGPPVRPLKEKELGPFGELSTSNPGSEVPGVALEAPNVSARRADDIDMGDEVAQRSVSDAEFVDGDEVREPRRRNSPSDPTSNEIEDHVLTGHASFRSWCAACVQGRGRAERHQGDGRKELENGSKVPDVEPKDTREMAARSSKMVRKSRLCRGTTASVRGVSWSEVATVPKRKSHRGLDLDLSLNTEVNIWKGWKENGGTK